MTTKTRRITDDSGTAYTIMVTYHNSNELNKVGFPNGITLYSIFSSGVCHSHYDEYELTQEMPGSAEWVIDELYDLESKL